MATQDTLNVGILLYGQVEELDFVGPYETFKVAGNQAMRLRQREQPAFRVFTVAEHAALVTTSGGLAVQPHFTLANHPPIDLLVVPGGNAEAQLENAAIVNWLRQVTRQTQINTSVCTGAFLLGHVGQADGRRITTHWGSLDRLAERFPQASVQRDLRWVDEGTLVTSAGISAGIDMSLHMVERLVGRDVAEASARYMEYIWNENPTRATEG